MFAADPPKADRKGGKYKGQSVLSANIKLGSGDAR